MEKGLPSMIESLQRLHGTAVVIDGKGVLLLGASGTGKSDLALRLIDTGAALVADDQVEMTTEDNKILLSVPDNLTGLLEVRGLGIVRMPHVPSAPLALLCELCPGDEIERLPATLHTEFMGVHVRRIALDPFTESATAKIRLALSVSDEDILVT